MPDGRRRVFGRWMQTVAASRGSPSQPVPASRQPRSSATSGRRIPCGPCGGAKIWPAALASVTAGRSLDRHGRWGRFPAGAREYGARGLDYSPAIDIVHINRSHCGWPLVTVFWTLPFGSAEKLPGCKILPLRRDSYQSRALQLFGEPRLAFCW